MALTKDIQVRLKNLYEKQANIFLSFEEYIKIFNPLGIIDRYNKGFEYLPLDKLQELLSFQNKEVTKYIGTDIIPQPLKEEEKEIVQQVQKQIKKDAKNIIKKMLSDQYMTIDMENRLGKVLKTVVDNVYIKGITSKEGYLNTRLNIPFEDDSAVLDKVLKMGVFSFPPYRGVNVKTKNINTTRGLYTGKESTMRDVGWKQINDTVFFMQVLFERLSGIVSTYMTEWDLSLYLQENLFLGKDFIGLHHRIRQDNPTRDASLGAYSYGVLNSALAKNTEKLFWNFEDYPLSKGWKPYKEDIGSSVNYTSVYKIEDFMKGMSEQYRQYITQMYRTLVNVKSADVEKTTFEKYSGIVSGWDKTMLNTSDTDGNPLFNVYDKWGSKEYTLKKKITNVWEQIKFLDYHGSLCCGFESPLLRYYQAFYDVPEDKISPVEQVVQSSGSHIRARAAYNWIKSGEKDASVPDAELDVPDFTDEDDFNTMGLCKKNPVNEGGCHGDIKGFGELDDKKSIYSNRSYPYPQVDELLNLSLKNEFYKPVSNPAQNIMDWGRLISLHNKGEMTYLKAQRYYSPFVMSFDEYLIYLKNNKYNVVNVLPSFLGRIISRRYRHSVLKRYRDFGNSYIDETNDAYNYYPTSRDWYRHFAVGYKKHDILKTPFLFGIKEAYTLRQYEYTYTVRKRIWQEGHYYTYWSWFRKRKRWSPGYWRYYNETKKGVKYLLMFDTDGWQSPTVDPDLRISSGGSFTQGIPFKKSNALEELKAYIREMKGDKLNLYFFPKKGSKKEVHILKFSAKIENIPVQKKVHKSGSYWSWFFKRNYYSYDVWENFTVEGVMLYAEDGSFFSLENIYNDLDLNPEDVAIGSSENNKIIDIQNRRVYNSTEELFLAKGVYSGEMVLSYLPSIQEQEPNIANAGTSFIKKGDYNSLRDVTLPVYETMIFKDDYTCYKRMSRPRTFVRTWWSWFKPKWVPVVKGKASWVYDDKKYTIDQREVNFYVSDYHIDVILKALTHLTFFQNEKTDPYMVSMLVPFKVLSCQLKYKTSLLKIIKNIVLPVVSKKEVIKTIFEEAVPKSSLMTIAKICEKPFSKETKPLYEKDEYSFFLHHAYILWYLEFDKHKQDIEDIFEDNQEKQLVSSIENILKKSSSPLSHTYFDITTLFSFLEILVSLKKNGKQEIRNLVFRSFMQLYYEYRWRFTAKRMNKADGTARMLYGFDTLKNLVKGSLKVEQPKSLAETLEGNAPTRLEVVKIETDFDLFDIKQYSRVRMNDSNLIKVYIPVEYIDEPTQRSFKINRILNNNAPEITKEVNVNPPMNGRYMLVSTESIQNAKNKKLGKPSLPFKPVFVNIIWRVENVPIRFNQVINIDSSGVQGIMDLCNAKIEADLWELDLRLYNVQPLPKRFLYEKGLHLLYVGNGDTQTISNIFLNVTSNLFSPIREIPSKSD